MKQMKQSGNPVVLTVNGKAEVVVQDAAAYQRLLERAEKAEMIEFLREAQADADAGRTVPAREFLESLGKKKKAKRTGASASGSPGRLLARSKVNMSGWRNVPRLRQTAGATPS